MASTYRARHVLTIDGATRLPPELVPEAALWDRLQSAITTGYVVPTDVTDEEYIDAVKRLCPQHAGELSALMGLDIKVGKAKPPTEVIETHEDPVDPQDLPELEVLEEPDREGTATPEVEPDIVLGGPPEPELPSEPRPKKTTAKKAAKPDPEPEPVAALVDDLLKDPAKEA